ncbi:HK97 gp10 family phage protein [Flavitalea sp.]|nr:HK97 gp10 family phage protein [Flavitalea sp.]
MPFSIKVEGLEQVLSRFKTFPERIQKAVSSELKLSAERVKRLAVKDAPGDRGTLRQNITVNQSTGIAFTTVVQNRTAAYMEWGTKSKRRIPAELMAYASSFQGPGPKGGPSMQDAIQAWVKRKKIAGTYSVKTKRRTGNKATKEKQDKALAFVIARSIRKNGVNPHPFFFKNVFIVRDELIKSIENIMKGL